MTEKCIEFDIPLCIGYIDVEKAFDSVKHEAILKALGTVNINETYLNILEDIYTEASARVHMNNQVLEEISILTGVRQVGPPCQSNSQQQIKALQANPFQYDFFFSL